MTEDKKAQAVQALIDAKYMHKQAVPVLQRAFDRGWAKGWGSISGFPQSGSLEEKSEFAWKYLLGAYPQENKTVFEKILSWHIRHQFLPEDLPRLYKAFDKFDRKKHKLPHEQQDISVYKTHRDFYAAIKSLEPQPVDLNFTWQEVQASLPVKALKALWQSDEAVLLHARTKKAAMATGEGTEWCTAYDEDNAFSSYKNNLLIVWTSQNHRVQIHFDSGSWKDEDDEQIDLVDFISDCPGLDQALLPYVKQTFSNMSAFSECVEYMIPVCEKIPVWKKYFREKGLAILAKSFQRLLKNADPDAEHILSGNGFVCYFQAMQADHTYHEYAASVLPEIKKAVSELEEIDSNLPNTMKCLAGSPWSEYYNAKIVPEILQKIKERLNPQIAITDWEISSIFSILGNIALSGTDDHRKYVRSNIFPELAHVNVKYPIPFQDMLGFYHQALKVPDWETGLEKGLLATLSTLKQIGCRYNSYTHITAGYRERAAAKSHVTNLLAAINRSSPAYYIIASDFIDGLEDKETTFTTGEAVRWVTEELKAYRNDPAAQNPHDYQQRIIQNIPRFLKMNCREVHDLLEEIFASEDTLTVFAKDAIARIDQDPRYGLQLQLKFFLGVEVAGYLLPHDLIDRCLLRNPDLETIRKIQIFLDGPLGKETSFRPSGPALYHAYKNLPIMRELQDEVTEALGILIDIASKYLTASEEIRAMISCAYDSEMKHSENMLLALRNPEWVQELNNDQVCEYYKYACDHRRFSLFEMIAPRVAQNEALAKDVPTYIGRLMRYDSKLANDFMSASMKHPQIWAHVEPEQQKIYNARSFSPYGTHYN